MIHICRDGGVVILGGYRRGSTAVRASGDDTSAPSRRDVHAPAMRPIGDNTFSHESRHHVVRIDAVVDGRLASIKLE